MKDEEILRINPNLCKKGATTKVAFRCGVHLSKKYSKKHKRKKFKKLKKEYIG